MYFKSYSNGSGLQIGCRRRNAKKKLQRLYIDFTPILLWWCNLIYEMADLTSNWCEHLLQMVMLGHDLSLHSSNVRILFWKIQQIVTLPGTTQVVMFDERREGIQFAESCSHLHIMHQNGWGSVKTLSTSCLCTEHRNL